METKDTRWKTVMALKHFYRLTGLICLLITFTTAASIDDDSISGLYEKALIEFQRNKFPTAAIHLKNALQQDPGFLAAHLLLGQVYLRQGDGASAEKELKIALRLGADRALVLTNLGNALKQQKKYQEIIEQIQTGNFNKEINAELLVLRGEALQELGKFIEAEETFRNASTLQPKAIPPLLGQVSVALRQGEYDRITSLLKKAIDIDPENSAVWQSKGSAAHAQGQLDQAIEYYSKALELSPNDYRIRVSIAVANMDAQRYQATLKILEHIDLDKSFDPQVPYLRAIAYAQLGDTSASRQSMLKADEIMAKLPTAIKEAHAETLLLSSLIQYSMNRMEEAQTDLEQYIKKVPHSLGAQKLMGSILYNRGEYDRVVQALTPFLRKAPNDRKLLTLLGSSHMKRGRHLKAIELLDRAIALEGEAIEARTNLALIYLARGQSDIALKQLQELFDSSAEARQAGITLVAEHLKRNENQQAVKIARLLSDRNPNDLKLLNLLASAEIAAGDLDAASEHLNKMLQSDSNSLGAQINLAKIDLLKGDPAQAKLRIEQASADHPGNPLVMVEQARLEELDGRPEAALELLKKAEALNDKSLSVNLYLGELYIKLDKKDELTRHLQKLERLYSDDLQAMRLRGIAHLNMEEPELAKVVFRRMSKLAGYQAPALIEISGYLQAANDLDGATWALMKAIKENPHSLIGRSALISVLLQAEKLEEADRQIKQLLHLHPDKPNGYHLRGDLLFKQANYGDAIISYQQAMDIEDTQQSALKIYQAYLLSGKAQRGVNFLEDQIQAGVNKPQTPALRKAVAEGHLFLGDMNKAAAHYQILVDSGTQDHQVFNNLAMIRFQQGDERALALAEQSHKLAPDDPSVNDTLGWVLVNKGQPEAGLGFLRNANIRAASNLTVRFHIAKALALLGRKDEAEAELTNLLSSSQEFADKAAAQDLLNKIKTAN